MEKEELSLQKTFLYLECITIALTAATQWGWVLNVIQFHTLVSLSFFLLAAESLLGIIMPHTTKWRFVHMLAQTVVICAACALGPPRRYTLYFLVLGAKAAALLPRPQMVTLAVVLLLGRVVAGACSEYLTRHVYIHRAPVSDFYTSVIVETELKLYVVIGLVTILFLGRTAVAQRKSRKVQQMLAKEAEQLAIEVERNKIAQDIHNSLGHTLTTVMIRLELAAKLLEENKIDKVKELATQSHESAVYCLQQVRRAVTAIRNDNVDPVPPANP